MSIVSVTLNAVASGPTQRLLYYTCTDHLGVVRECGPVVTNDPAFDAEAHKAVISAKLTDALAALEAASLLE